MERSEIPFPQRSLANRVMVAGSRRSLVAIRKAAYFMASRLPGFRFIRETAGAQNPCLFRYWFWQKILGCNRQAYWPVHFSSRINQPQNVLIGVDTAPGYEPGCYIQAIGPVVIGDYTQIAANVGIISANHVPTDLRRHDSAPGVTIGSYCWLGMGSIITPGVTLGDFTVVGANAVVTRSFPDGYCVVAGAPARKIRELAKDECVQFENELCYYGYVSKRRFPAFRRSRLGV